MKQYRTNSTDTFIEIAQDRRVLFAEIPPLGKEKYINCFVTDELKEARHQLSQMLSPILALLQSPYITIHFDAKFKKPSMHAHQILL